MVSKRLFVGAMALAFIAGGVAIYFSFHNTVIIIGEQQATSTVAMQLPQKATCDGPSSITPDDLYASRSVNYVDTAGKAGSLSDACTASGQVNKTYCYENPPASGNLVAGQVAYSCPFGCMAGACRKPQASSTFAFPYPVTWTEGSIEFDVTGVFWGTITATPDLVNGQGNPYPASSTINALVLSFKVSNNSSSQASVPLNIRRLADEQGDLEQSASPSFIFPVTGTNLLGPLRTYADEKVVFVVPDDLRNFVFTTGGASNAFFSVDIQDDWTVKIQKEPTSESG